MSLSDILILGIRWLHGIAAVAWVGGGIFYLLVLRPSMRRSIGQGGGLGQAVGQEFRGMVNVAIAVLIVTGVVLTFHRLTSDFVGPAYVGVLAAKISLSLYTFYLVRFLRWRTYPEEVPGAGGRWRHLGVVCTGTTAILIIGVVVFLLSDVLREIFEDGLKG